MIPWRIWTTIRLNSTDIYSSDLSAVSFVPFLTLFVWQHIIYFTLEINYFSENSLKSVCFCILFMALGLHSFSFYAWFSLDWLYSNINNLCIKSLSNKMHNIGVWHMIKDAKSILWWILWWILWMLCFVHSTYYIQ